MADNDVGVNANFTSTEFSTSLTASTVLVDYGAYKVRHLGKAELAYSATMTRLAEGSLDLTLLGDSFSSGFRNSFSLKSSYSVNVGFVPYMPAIQALFQVPASITGTALLNANSLLPYIHVGASNCTQQWSVDNSRTFSLRMGASLSVNKSTSHNWGLGPSFTYASGPSYGILAYGKRELFIGSYEIIGVSPEDIQGFKAERGVGGALLASINGGKAKAHSLKSGAPRMSINTTSALMRAGALGTGAGIEVDGSKVTLTSGQGVSIVVGPSSIVLRVGATSLEISKGGINIVTPKSIKISSKDVNVSTLEGMNVTSQLNVLGILEAFLVTASGVDLVTHTHGVLPFAGPVPPPIPTAKYKPPKVAPAVPPSAPPMPVGVVHESINLAEDAHTQKANLAAAIPKDPPSSA